MRRFSSSIKEITLSESKLRSEYEKYLSIQSSSLYKLYERGILSKVEYDEAELRSSLMDLLGDNSKYICSSMTGEVTLDTSMLSYCMHILSTESYVDDLQIVYDYINATKNVTDLSEAIRIGSKFNFRVNPVITFSRLTISYRCKINFANPVIIGCVAEKEGYRLQKIDMRLPVYKVLCKEVGVPQSVVTKAVKINQGVFIRGMSLKQELSLLNSLLEGDLNIDFVYGKRLESTVINFYNQSDVSETSFSAYIIDKSFDVRNNLFNACISKLSDFEPVCASIDFMYIYAKGVVSKRQVTSTVPMGMFIIDNLGTELSSINLFNGLSGEFVSAEYCAGHNLTVTGIPTKIKQVDLDKKSNSLVVNEYNYYSISQVRDLDGEPLKSCVGVDYKPFPYTLDYIASSLKVGKNELSAYFYMKSNPVLSTTEVPMQRYKSLIADYAYMLTSAKCGISDNYKDVLNRESYSSELLMKVVYEADILVDKVLSSIH